MDSVPEIECHRCRAMKPITEFSPDKRCPARYNRTTYCRPCRRDAYLARLEANPKTRYLVVRRDQFTHAASIEQAVISGELPSPLIVCNECRELKPLTEFHRNHTLPGRYFRNTYCKRCVYAQHVRFKSAQPERFRARTRRGALKGNFGLTTADYERMLDAQHSVCAICQKPETDMQPQTGQVRRLAVDHDHATGRVRGLLCHQCNTGIGKLRHSPKILRAAIAYLKGR